MINYNLHSLYCTWLGFYHNCFNHLLQHVHYIFILLYKTILCMYPKIWKIYLDKVKITI